VLIYLNLFFPGGFDIQLSKLYPELKFVVQDRGPVLKQAENSIWPKENPAALVAGRVKFMEHDFFQKNPVQGAEVYWMRYILCVSSHIALGFRLPHPLTIQTACISRTDLDIGPSGTIGRTNTAFRSSKPSNPRWAPIRAS
jgi:hypothetical protein